MEKTERIYTENEVIALVDFVLEARGKEKEKKIGESIKNWELANFKAANPPEILAGPDSPDFIKTPTDEEIYYAAKDHAFRKDFYDANFTRQWKAAIEWYTQNFLVK